MAGRGRGKLQTYVDPNSSPLRRPLASNTINDYNSFSIKSDCSNKDFPTDSTNKDILPQKVSNLSINTWKTRTSKDSKDNAEDMCKTIMETVTTVESLTKSAVEFFNYALIGKDEALTAALVVKNLEAFAVNDLTFRTAFLNEMGTTFTDIDKLRKNNPQRFQNFVVLLCEVSRNFPKIKVMRDAMIKALGMLLSEGTNEDIFIFREEIKKIGPILRNEQSENFANIMMNVRKVILLSQTSNRSRCLLLECLELYLNNWETLPTSVKLFYDGYN